MGKEFSIALPGTGLVLVGAVLVGAKIWGGLDWPWWLVTLPLWIVVGVALFGLLLLVGFAVLVILALLFGGRR